MCMNCVYVCMCACVYVCMCNRVSVYVAACVHVHGVKRLGGALATIRTMTTHFTHAGADSVDVAFLVVGDPFGATTHTGEGCVCMCNTVCPPAP